MPLKQHVFLIPTRLQIFSDASMVEDLKFFHFLEEAIPDLKKELPTYLAFADGVAEVSLVDWWMRHEQKIPCWAEACQKVLLSAILGSSRKGFQYPQQFFWE